MRYIILIMAMMVGMEACAQEQYPKEDVKRLRKLITKNKSRTPLPRLMSSDRECVDELYDLTARRMEDAK